MTVYDCTMFLNENDLYEIRLNQHWNFVDKFIVIESKETHTGLKKGLNFDQERFKPYAEKIIYVTFDSFDEEIAKHPELLDHVTLSNRGSNTESKDWTRDHFQFNYMVKVLKDNGAEDSDVIYFSCCDEILSEDAFNRCAPIFENKSQYFTAQSYWGNRITPIENMRPILYFNMYLYAYKFNLLHKHWNDHMCGTMTEFENFKKILPSSIRTQFYLTHTIVPNAGWHFTFLDPTDGELVLQKQKSWAHSRDARSGNAEGRYYDVDSKQEAVRRIFVNYTPTLVDITSETHPKYIMDNLDKLQNFIYKG